ncbi:YcaO-like family protein (plasmid) [Streptomyces sp. FXJ1.172]|uniref:YcaO-like family protein n=1 Tax=Streptomyces sp. FXJ1.172 TaxID=710705 RepID=UPI0023DD66A1|nr:YcaO-like family protein [Streptomyces sp. FXJ1.172]WEP00922.1 YcaO-like family protein [Streptomyces sp. FXJ1.172]
MTLSRALTEAAQSRATAIAGARDDIGQAPYREAHFFSVNRSPAAPLEARDAMDFTPIISTPLRDLRDETVHLARRIESVTGSPPLYVDLTRPDICIPVVHVVCPGALSDTAH